MTKKIQKSVSFIIIIVLALSITLYSKTKIDDFPKPKYTSLEDDYVVLSKQIHFIVNDVFEQKYKASFDSLKNTIDNYALSDTKPLDIVFTRELDLTKIDVMYASGLKLSGSYLLNITKNKIILSAKDDEGLLNALSTLEVLIEKNDGKIQERMIVDFPDLKMRVLHISMWPCTIEDFKETIRLARLEHFNTLIWLNHFGVKLKSLKHLKANNKNRWSIEEFKEMVVYVKQNGLEIIPELKLLSHQKKFMRDAYPQYMYNKATYNPEKKDLYTKVVFPAIDELLLLTGATKFHIGHDEVAGWSEWHYRTKILNKNDKQLPPKLFLKDIKILNDYLKNKNIETWMWSDMLYTKKEFPSMKKAGANLNGMNGYASIRLQIPQDIVMNVWHYRGSQKEFPTLKFLSDNGYKVLGATWKFENTTENYARYIYNLDNQNAQGMIATTWFALSGDKKEEVNNIIKFSGKAFWNAK